MVYSYNPNGAWTGKHQMSVNGKRDEFFLDDLLSLANSAGIKTGLAKGIVDQVAGAVSEWAVFAEQAGVPESTVAKIKMTHRRV